jgi:hypothetical protein
MRNSRTKLYFLSCRYLPIIYSKKLKNKKASSHEEGFLGLLILHSHSAYFTKHIVHSNNEG